MVYAKALFINHPPRLLATALRDNTEPAHFARGKARRPSRRLDYFFSVFFSSVFFSSFFFSSFFSPAGAGFFSSAWTNVVAPNVNPMTNAMIANNVFITSPPFHLMSRLRFEAAKTRG
jgi:hypothetical protein